MPDPIKPDYGVDAPDVMRNFFLIGGLCLLLGLFLPNPLPLTHNVSLNSHSFFWPAGFLIAQGLLFLLYVKFGKFRHRDFILSLHNWTPDDLVLDVGCGRGLLLVGAAKRLQALNGQGHATGIDVWSNDDMGANSESATRNNLRLEDVADRCTLLTVPAQQMTFPDAHFDVIVSNLCLHNIYDPATRSQALDQIVRVLKPGGTALISDYKLTSEHGFKRVEVPIPVQ